MQGFGEKLINVTGGKPEMEKTKILKIPQGLPFSLQNNQGSLGLGGAGGDFVVHLPLAHSWLVQTSRDSTGGEAAVQKCWTC